MSIAGSAEQIVDRPRLDAESRPPFAAATSGFMSAMAANVEHRESPHRLQILARDVARADDADAQTLPCRHCVLRYCLPQRPTGRAVPDCASLARQAGARNPVRRFPPKFCYRPAMPPLPSTFDYRPPPGLDIVYEDDRLIVCNKPSGLLTVPGKDSSLADCLEARVQARYPERPATKVVHRLDKDTSGLILLAFDKPALASLGSQFEHRQDREILRGARVGRARSRERPHRSAARDRLGEQAAPARRLRARPGRADALGDAGARGQRHAR